jgi:hypothetical protein
MQRRKAFPTVYQALTGKPGELNCDFALNSSSVQTLRGVPPRGFDEQLYCRNRRAGLSSQRREIRRDEPHFHREVQEQGIQGIQRQEHVPRSNESGERCSCHPISAPDFTSPKGFEGQQARTGFSVFELVAQPDTAAVVLCGTAFGDCGIVAGAQRGLGLEPAGDVHLHTNLRSA